MRPRVRFWTLALLGILGCGAVPVLAQAPAEPPTEAADASDPDFHADILELIDQLDADRLLLRQQAERQLIDKGPAALPLLPTDRQRLSAEAKMRLSRVRLALQKQKAKQGTKAITVRLSGAGTLNEALERISAASGVEFEVDAEANVAIDLGQVGPLSFWQALDIVLDAANLDINFYGGGEGIQVLQPRAEDRPLRVDAGAYAGVYRLEPTRVTARRVFQQPQQSGLSVTIEIAWEPRLTPIGLTVPLSELQAKLDDGTTLTPIDNSGELNVATNPDLAFSELVLPLELPAGRPRKMETLSGVIRALIPGPAEKFAFPLDDGADEQQQGAMTVALEAIRANGALHELRVVIQLKDADRALESHRQWIFENPAYVTAKDGSRLEHLGYQIFRQSSSEVGIGYLFDLSEQPAGFTFHYESPTGVIPNEVAFVVPDLLLP